MPRVSAAVRIPQRAPGDANAHVGQSVYAHTSVTKVPVVSPSLPHDILTDSPSFTSTGVGPTAQAPGKPKPEGQLEPHPYTSISPPPASVAVHCHTQ